MLRIKNSTPQEVHTMENILYEVRKMLMDGIDENIVSEWVYGKLENGKITTRMYELAISTIADMTGNYIL